jgi:hypothetical protein
LFKERIQLSPKTDLPRFSCLALGELGETEEGRRVLRADGDQPEIFLRRTVGRLPFRNQVDDDPLAEGLSNAGIRLECKPSARSEAALTSVRSRHRSMDGGGRSAGDLGIVIKTYKYR